MHDLNKNMQWLCGWTRKNGKDVANMKAYIEDILGAGYFTNGDLTAIRNKLVSDGVIEIES